MADQYPINVFTETYRGEIVKTLDTIDEFGKSCNWADLIEFLKGHEHVNCCKLPLANDNTTPSLNTPLHYAALNDAPLDIIEKLIQMEASKCLKNSDGKTAYDVGMEKGLHPDKLDLIKVPEEINEKAVSIQKMEQGLHSVINGRVDDLIKKNGQALPQLAYLFEKGSFYYPVPGMYGGFNVNKTKDGGISADSWIRICGGSEENHVIDKEGNVTLLPNPNPI